MSPRARPFLLNITGGSDLGLFEINEAAEIINSAADKDCNIIFGAVVDPSFGDEVRVTVVATGFDRPFSKEAPPQRRETAPPPREREREREPQRRSFEEARPSFHVDEDVLDIPSFLRNR